MALFRAGEHSRVQYTIHVMLTDQKLCKPAKTLSRWVLFITRHPFLGHPFCFITFLVPSPISIAHRRLLAEYTAFFPNNHAFAYRLDAVQCQQPLERRVQMCSSGPTRSNQA
jgi:hypothetical protein